MKRPVGVREMRQNLSVYLDRVKAGETLHVTEYGQVVALLAPLPAQRLTTFERLVREGRATAPAGSLKNRRPPQSGAERRAPKKSWMNCAKSGCEAGLLRLLGDREVVSRRTRLDGASRVSRER